MVNVFASSVVDRWLESQSVQTKDYKCSIYYFNTTHITLTSKNKDWLARNQDMSQWSDMSTRRFFFFDLAL